MNVSLLDVKYTQRLPTPLALAATALAEETARNGVHTTADEMAGCVEALFGLVGRLWVAEYLAAGAPDAEANALLHRTLVTTHKDPLLGNWISVSRALRAVFLERHLAPVIDELADLDFGAYGDDDHPVARLSTYRNSFAHGTFHAVVDDIVRHREQLEGLLTKLPFLVDRPILVDDGSTVLALRGAAEAATRPSATLTPHHPTFVGKDGRTVSLYPLAVSKDASGVAALVWTNVNKGKKGPGPRDIANHALFSVWAERFQRELDGDVEAAAACLGEPHRDAAIVAPVQDALSRLQASSGRLLLVESPPGAPRSAVLAACAGSDALRWRVTTGELMGSGLVLVKALARHAERVLGLDRSTFSLNESSAWRDTLQAIAARCEASGRQLRLVLDDLHLGADPARPGEPSIQDVHRALASGPWLVVTGSTRFWSVRPLPWDERVELGWEAGFEVGAFERFLAERANSPLHRRLLRSLAQTNGQSSLFEICDALEATPEGGASQTTFLFEPAVERALWDIAPLLTLRRDLRAENGPYEEVRTFGLLDHARLSAVLMEAR